MDEISRYYSMMIEYHWSLKAWVVAFYSKFTRSLQTLISIKLTMIKVSNQLHMKEQLLH